ncbi:MAG: BspA family leucine-rich repeat surface protein [Clostridium sp.]|nr:BspA family leucine-rich repeat surface protein [Clostridium sp.]
MNKKGFTLVELLAVIAILAILVIIALPNVIKMYNDSKKNAFMTEVQNLAKEVSSKYISESMKGNKVTVISNKQNPLDMTGRELEYNFELDSQGKIKNMIVSNGTYCISTNKDYTKITRNDISDKCSYNDLYKTVGTLTKNFYEESGRTDRSLVSSIVFYSDGRTVSGAESYDVSEKKDASIKMYVSQNSENTSLLDLTIVANGKIAFPEDSSSLFAFYRDYGYGSYAANLQNLQFNNSVSTFNVTNMKNMFERSKATTLDLSSFDTSNVTNMDSMFRNSKVTSLDLSSFNTSNVTNMSWMFGGSQVTTLDLSSFDTSNVTNMSHMFSGSQATTLDLNSFDTSKVTDMEDMFSSSKVTSLDLSSFDTSKVTDMSWMFYHSATTEIKGLNKFNTSKVTDMYYMFYGSKATTLDLSSFDTSNVTKMNSMFYNSAATEIKGLNKFNTSKVTDMDDMFSYSKATTLDLSSFDTSNVTNMSLMFKNAEATTGYARTQSDADKFNNSFYKPSSLTFVVK